MKFIHTSDLHIGKRLNEYPLIEDQKYILSQLMQVAKEEEADAVVIAGDIYDKSIPAAEAVPVLDKFIREFAEAEIPLLMISGNHDSPERLEYGSRLMERSGVYIAGMYDGSVKMCEIKGVEFYLLPFLRPSVVRRYYPEAKIENTEDAVRTVIDEIHPSKKSVIVSHQTVIAAGNELIRCDSEIPSIGGSDAVSYTVYDKFDYVALGHIHSPQSVGRESVRYSGTPLKYSKSEASHIKTVSVVEITESGITVTERELKPLRDLRVIRGEIDELLNKEVYSQASTDDYIYAVLTDDIQDMNYMSRIQHIYPNCIGIEIDNLRSAYDNDIDTVQEDKSPSELFEDFFKMQNNREMTDEEREIITGFIKEALDE